MNDFQSISFLSQVLMYDVKYSWPHQMEQIVMKVTVVNVNDRPIMAKTTYDFPQPLPYKIVALSQGSKVSGILTTGTVEDPDLADITNQMGTCDS